MTQTHSDTETPAARAQRHLGILREVQELTLGIIRHTARQIMETPPVVEAAPDAAADKPRPRRAADPRTLYERLVRSLHQTLAQEVLMAKALREAEAEEFAAAEDAVAHYAAGHPAARRAFSELPPELRETGPQAAVRETIAARRASALAVSG